MPDDKFSTIEELEQEVLEEKRIFRSLLEVHREKIKGINGLVELWGSESEEDIGKAEKIFAQIKDKWNKKIKDLIKRLIHLQDAEWRTVTFKTKDMEVREKIEHKQSKFRFDEKRLLKALLHDVAEKNEEHAEGILEHLNDDAKWKIILASLSSILKEIGNLLKYLNDLINSQNFHLKEMWTGKLSEDIEEHEAFYRLLIYETEVDNRLKKLLIELEELLKITIYEEKQEEKLTFKQVFHKYDHDLIALYKDVFSSLFSRDELDDFDTWTWGLGCKSDIRKFSPDDEGRIYEEVDRYHFVVAKLGKKVVGGTCFEFMGTYEVEGKIRERVKLPGKAKDRIVHLKSDGHYDLAESNYCIGWYTAVLPKYRKRGIGKELLRIREKILKNDSKVFGFDEFEGILIEIDDPSKMDEKTLKSKTDMDPVERMNFYKRHGYKKLDFNYIQPPVDYGKKPLFYYSFAIKPFKKEWKKGVPSLAVLSFLYHYIIMACDHFKWWKSKWYFEMEKELKRKKFVELVNLDADFSKYGKY